MSDVRGHYRQEHAMSTDNAGDGLREAVEALCEEWAGSPHGTSCRHAARLRALLVEHPAPPVEVETKAMRDVLAERRHQIEKGYTPEHDDDHPPSRIIGYGGLSWYRFTRAELVRATACLLAAIERIDRAEERGQQW